MQIPVRTSISYRQIFESRVTSQCLGKLSFFFPGGCHLAGQNLSFHVFQFKPELTPGSPMACDMKEVGLDDHSDRF